MKDRLINYFSKLTSLSADEVEKLTDTMVIKHMEKGSFLLKEGQRNENTYFVLAGLVRQYKNVDGVERTTNFFSDEQWILSFTTFAEDTVSLENLVCAEDTTVVIGNEKKAMELFKVYPRFETISRIVMETVFSQDQTRMSFYLTDTPEQRYLRLMETNRGLFQRVPQYQLASYIGVTPESLSRIRKRLSRSS